MLYVRGFSFEQEDIMQALTGKNILLIISGGIAAYKSLELIRLLKKSGAQVRCILTKGGEQFVTPLSVSSLSEEKVYTDLWSLTDESEMGHIRLGREADLIVIAPASANMIGKMAHGLGDDLASTTLLAADGPILIAPAMNPHMWNNPAVQENIHTLEKRGIKRIGPADGDTACGETGTGRMAEPEKIFDTIISHFQNDSLFGYKAIVTSGPTYEPIDPVRFIGNRSSGRQGHAIAASLAASGAQVTLITGPVALPDPPGCTVIHVETANEMMDAAQKSLPADIAVCAAAVADWAPAKPHNGKIKKRGDKSPPQINLTENPDILTSLSKSPQRPALVIGFAAETENLLEAAREKRLRKGCEWIMANNVSEKVFGEEENHVYLVSENGEEEWPRATKQKIADTLTDRITEFLKHHEQRPEAAE